MIRMLRGKVIEIAPFVTIEAGGIGYAVFTAEQFTIGQTVQLWIYHHIREDRQELYGFTTKERVRLFEMLLGVSGIGPKAALAILRHLDAGQIEGAIIKNDTTILSSVPGIGNKAAAKIIVELKNKLDKLGEVSIEGLERSSELVEGLKSLGYSQREIYAIIKKIPANLSNLQAQLTWALRQLGKK